MGSPLVSKVSHNSSRSAREAKPIGTHNGMGFQLAQATGSAIGRSNLVGECEQSPKRSIVHTTPTVKLRDLKASLFAQLQKITQSEVVWPNLRDRHKTT
jgi:hypothetical protein